MDLLHLKGISDKNRYSIYSSFLAFILGIYFYRVPLASEHMNFFYSLPLASFICTQIGWKLVMKTNENYSFSNIAALSLILTITTSFLNWFILAIERRITGDYTDYNGQQESIITTLIYYPFFQTFLSLLMVGFVGVLLFIISGLFVIKTKHIK